MAIDKPSVLAIATAYGVPGAGILVYQIPDADPLHANGEWLASLAKISLGRDVASGFVGPIAYGPTEDAAAHALYAAVKSASTTTAAKASADATAAANQAAAVNAVVTK
jgi:hypothetical protein